jgi:hypothetical protein
MIQEGESDFESCPHGLPLFLRCLECDLQKGIPDEDVDDL